MSVLGSLVRFLRPASDALVPFAYNRAGFEYDRHGFVGDVPTAGEGRVALVTGANSGIGRATAKELVARGYEVWLLCRDRARGEEAQKDLASAAIRPVHLSIVDVSRLDSVRRFARECGLERVDVLIHCAGVLPSERTLTDDGIELTFATHVVGPYALTLLMAEPLLRSDDARVVFVASGGLYLQRLDLDIVDATPGAFDGLRAYANAKRAQVLLARLFAKTAGEHGRVTFASMHPGWVDTPALETSLPRFYGTMRSALRSARQGADTVVWLATDDTARGTPGLFWFDRRVVGQYPLPWTRESEAARADLVRRCERASGLSLSSLADAARRSPQISIHGVNP